MLSGRASGALLVNILVNLFADSIFSQSIQPVCFKFHTWFLPGLCFHVKPCSFQLVPNFLVKNAFFFQLFSNDLALNYVNVSVEPFGDLSVSEGVPFNQQHTGIVTVFEYRSVLLVLVGLLREYAYSADLAWLPNFIIFFFSDFFCSELVSAPPAYIGNEILDPNRRVVTGLTCI